MERRKPSLSKPSALPLDYLKMVAGVFTNNFETGLVQYARTAPEPYFEAHGEVTTDEVILAISLMNRDQLAATTVYASCDFDPKASSPTIQDLLSACLDAAGAVFSSLFSSENEETIANLALQSLSALENVPFEWTEIEADKKRVYVKIDKSNLSLDKLTEDWLNKNDPGFKKREEELARETEKLFFTGPKNPKEEDPDDQGSGHLH